MKANALKNHVATALAALYLAVPFQSACQQTDKIFMAIEFNHVLCGYSEVLFSDTLIHGHNHIVLDQKTYANFHALGRDISQHQEFLYYINPVSGNFIYHKSYLQQGATEMGGDTYVEAGHLRMVDLDGKEEITNLPDEIILPNTVLFDYLKKDFADRELKSQKYKVYDLRTRQVNEIEYIKVGEERIELAGKEYDAVVLSESDPASGLHNKIWIDKSDGMRLKIESPNKISIYLTDSSVPQKIKTGNWDMAIFVKTNEKINDIRSISFMKVKVRLEAIPQASIDDLNVVGQQFTGTLNETFIDGEFTISHERFKGLNAPDFPFDTRKFNIPEVYVGSEDNIESDDPELISLAQKITAGSVNSWEASCKISNWVANNIEGSILDGSAKETYVQKSGLCGAQSKLMAALCRAVGIPARVVWGCTYTREMEGSFGHHGWNEVFMGEAGWIPVDVTLHETDYIDSGHIRLGILKTPQTIINYEEVSILDYKLSQAELELSDR